MQQLDQHQNPDDYQRDARFTVKIHQFCIDFALAYPQADLDTEVYCELRQSNRIVS